VATCRFCGRDFEPTPQRPRNCSPECSKAYHSYGKCLADGGGTVYSRPCRWCGKTFETRRIATYCCSRPCSDNDARRRVRVNKALRSGRDPHAVRAFNDDQGAALISRAIGERHLMVVRIGGRYRCAEAVDTPTGWDFNPPVFFDSREDAEAWADRMVAG
jgi:hypothetical protein